MQPGTTILCIRKTWEWGKGKVVLPISGLMQWTRHLGLNSGTCLTSSFCIRSLVFAHTHTHSARTGTCYVKAIMYSVAQIGEWTGAKTEWKHIWSSVIPNALPMQGRMNLIPLYANVFPFMPIFWLCSRKGRDFSYYRMSSNVWGSSSVAQWQGTCLACLSPGD